MSSVTKTKTTLNLSIYCLSTLKSLNFNILWKINSIREHDDVRGEHKISSSKWTIIKQKKKYGWPNKQYPIKKLVDCFSDSNLKITVHRTMYDHTAHQIEKHFCITQQVFINWIYTNNSTNIIECRARIMNMYVIWEVYCVLCIYIYYILLCFVAVAVACYGNRIPLCVLYLCMGTIHRTHIVCRLLYTVHHHNFVVSLMCACCRLFGDGGIAPWSDFISRIQWHFFHRKSIKFKHSDTNWHQMNMSKPLNTSYTSSRKYRWKLLEMNTIRLFFWSYCYSQSSKINVMRFHLIIHSNHVSKFFVTAYTQCITTVGQSNVMFVIWICKCLSETQTTVNWFEDWKWRARYDIVFYGHLTFRLVLFTFVYLPTKVDPFLDFWWEFDFKINYFKSISYK